MSAHTALRLSDLAGAARDLPWRLAVPSWVWPGDVASNCRKLAPSFQEVALSLFESRPIPPYSPADFPPELCASGLHFHVHLPQDLPWTSDPEAAAAVLDELLDLTAHLEPWGYVLHAPAAPRLLDAAQTIFRQRGIAPERVLLENTADFDLAEFWCDIKYLGFSACLDLGHLLAYGQERVLGLPQLFSRVRMLHLAAPGENGAHAPLTSLSTFGREMLRRMLAKLDRKAVVTLELFSAQDLADSLEALLRWSRSWGLAAA